MAALASGRPYSPFPVLCRSGADRAEGTAAEPHHAAPVILDRKHDPMAEAIVAGAPVLRGHDQARLEQLPLGIAFGEHGALERVAIVRRIAEAEALDGRLIQPAPLQIRGCRGALAGLETSAEPAGGGLIGSVDGPVDSGLAWTS